MTPNPFPRASGDDNKIKQKKGRGAGGGMWFQYEHMKDKDNHKTIRTKQKPAHPVLF
jgi:hypothetical protein